MKIVRIRRVFALNVSNQTISSCENCFRHIFAKILVRLFEVGIVTETIQVRHHSRVTEPILFLKKQNKFCYDLPFIYFSRGYWILVYLYEGAHQ